MIRLFVFCLLALGLGVYLQLQFAADPGYVLVSFKGYDVEATLGAAVIAMLAIFIIFFGAIWVLKTINPLKLFSKDSWLVFSRKKRARLGTEKGLQLLLLGQWQQSYKLLVENAGRVDSPLFNYLAASLAAFQHGDKISWAYCLDRAEHNSRISAPAIRNLKATMELKSGQLEQSLAIFLALKKEMPSSVLVLNSIKDIYVAIADWEKLWELLPELEKNKSLSAEELYALTEQAILFRISKAANQGDLETLKSVWNTIPKQLKMNEKAGELYLRSLIAKGHDTEATNVLTRFLKRNWSDALVEVYGFVESEEPGPALLLLEGYVKDRPNNAVLALTLGRLSLRKQLWGKAREYFQNALSFSNKAALSAEINAELARLLDSLGEHEASTAHYRQAMSLLERKLPDLPMPIKGGLS